MHPLYGVREQKKTSFFFSFLHLDTVLSDSTPEYFPQYLTNCIIHTLPPAPPTDRGHFCLRSPIRQEFPFQGVLVIPPTPWNLQDLRQKPMKKKLLACSALKGISQHLNRVIRENTILFAFPHLLPFLVRIGLNRNLLIFLNNLCVY